MDAAKKAGSVIVKDAIADITLQQVLTRPDEFDVIATLNLNGDYLSDALAAQVGGIGIAPGGNINYLTGHAVFEATHGTAPKYANLDKVNPGSRDPLRRDDAALPGLGRGRRCHHRRHGPHHRAEDRDLRFRPADGGCEGSLDQRLRRRADPEPLAPCGGSEYAPPAHADPMTGYSGTPLAKKLGMREGSRLFAHAAPEHYAALLAPLPEGARIVTRLDECTDVIHLFAVQRAALSGSLRSTLKGMRADAAIWVSWPKKSSGVATELTEDVIREVALPMTLVDIKVCAVDEIWSGLKLVIRKAARPAPGKRAAAPRAQRAARRT